MKIFKVLGLRALISSNGGPWQKNKNKTKTTKKTLEKLYLATANKAVGLAGHTVNVLQILQLRQT